MVPWQRQPCRSVVNKTAATTTTTATTTTSFIGILAERSAARWLAPDPRADYIRIMPRQLTVACVRPRFKSPERPVDRGACIPPSPRGAVPPPPTTINYLSPDVQVSGRWTFGNFLIFSSGFSPDYAARASAQLCVVIRPKDCDVFTLHRSRSFRFLLIDAVN